MGGACNKLLCSTFPVKAGEGALIFEGGVFSGEYQHFLVLRTAIVCMYMHALLCLHKV